MSKPKKYKRMLKKGIVELPNGCTLFWKFDPLTGGREYFSDEVGGGAFVWHTALINESTLLAALTEEARLLMLEHIIKDRKSRGKKEQVQV